MKIFVGNISFTAKDKDVKKAFEAYGEVDSISIKKKAGENARGFGFVTMLNETEALAAIAALEGKELMGKPMSVTVGRPKPVKPKKDFKEIKRLRKEAKSDGLIARLSAVAIEDLKPEVVVAEAKPKVEPKDLPKKKAQAPSGSKAWIKRKGTGKANPWKKNPGGIKKKFKSER